MRKHTLVGIGTSVWIDLREGVNRVGRNPANEIHIPDASISSFHAELVVDGDRALVKDLGSTNGTTLDGSAITEALLSPSQILRFGSVEFRYESGDDSIQVNVPTVSNTAGLPEPKFLQDGTPACLNHAELAATHQCRQCGHTLCSDCVRSLKISGGKHSRFFCSQCSGPCLPLEPATRKNAALQFLGKLAETLRIKRK